MGMSANEFKVKFTNGEVEVVDPNLLLGNLAIDFSGLMTLSEIVDHAAKFGFKMRDFMDGQPGSKTFEVVFQTK
jgi:hypothetical protein